MRALGLAVGSSGAVAREEEDGVREREADLDLEEEVAFMTRMRWTSTMTPRMAAK